MFAQMRHVFKPAPRRVQAPRRGDERNRRLKLARSSPDTLRIEVQRDRGYCFSALSQCSTILPFLTRNISNQVVV